jgi:hypothetical protein
MVQIMRQRITEFAQGKLAGFGLKDEPSMGIGFAVVMFTVCSLVAALTFNAAEVISIPTAWQDEGKAKSTDDNSATSRERNHQSRKEDRRRWRLSAALRVPVTFRRRNG